MADDPEKGSQDERPKREWLRECFQILFQPSKESDANKKQSDDRFPFELLKLKQLLDRENVDIIMKSLTCHRSFRDEGFHSMENLPKFHDLTRYDVDEVTELELWQFEVERLKDAAISPSTPTLALEVEPEWFGQKTDTDGYRRLHMLVQQLYYALEICTHDNELLLMEHYPLEANKQAYENAHGTINQVFDAEAREIRYERQLKLKEIDEKAIHALVNYITAILVRIFTRSLGGTFWVHNTIAVLAKFSAKLKVLTANLPHSFEKTLEAHQEIRDRLLERQIETKKTRDAFELPSKCVDDFAHRLNYTIAYRLDDNIAHEQRVLEDYVHANGGRYFFEMARWGHSVGSILKGSIRDLMYSGESWRKLDEFETCSVIYKTGFDERRHHLCQKRDGSIGATGTTRLIDLAGVAFDIACDIWDELPTENQETVPHTFLTWTYITANPESVTGKTAKLLRHLLNQPESPEVVGTNEQSKYLTTMKAVIQALVPYTLYCGSSSSDLSRLANTMMLTRHSRVPMEYYKQGKATMFARIMTSAHKKAIENENRAGTWDKRDDTLDDYNQAKPVYKTDMAKRAKDGKPLMKISHHLQDVSKWQISEYTITIKKPWYGHAVMAFCVLIIGGGVALIALQDRIVGVDPSSLTALVWGAAGFVMLWFKAQKVQDWPWRDFFSGDVVCRSVSEVADVTSMKPQTLIAILLKFDHKLALEAQGPYNSLFKKENAAGFAIDQPVQTKTAVCGGFIFVEVETLKGRALVTVSAKLPGFYDWATPMDHSRGRHTHVCIDTQEPLHYQSKSDRRWGRGKGKNRSQEWWTRRKKWTSAVYATRKEPIEWLTIRGVFGGESYFD